MEEVTNVIHEQPAARVLGARPRQPAHPSRRPLRMKRSDLIECKGLFLFFSGAAGARWGFQGE